MTVLEGIQKSAEFFEKKQIDSPRLQAELLLAHLLKLPRMKLYLNFNRALSDSEVDAFRDMILRRSVREPLQHITGSTSFCGHEIRVNKYVLIPRPETELLAELGSSFLEQIVSEDTTALDFGTGSGCIAIALGLKCPKMKITATDLSTEALAVAQDNAADYRLNGQIEFLQGDGFAILSKDQKFDLIISNPPYIPTAEIETLQPEVKDHDPRIALDGGKDGLDFYRRFANSAQEFLKPSGKIMLEFGDGQSESIRKIFEEQNWIVEAIKPDYTQRPRILVARC